MLSLLLTATLSSAWTVLSPGVAAAQSTPSTSTQLYVSPTGSDNSGNNLCNNSGTPCATVDQAVYAAVYYGGSVTINLDPGTYNQQVTVTPGSANENPSVTGVNGTQLTSLTLQPNPQESGQVLIEPQSLAANLQEGNTGYFFDDNTGATYAIVGVKAPGVEVTIDGLTVTGADLSATGNASGIAMVDTSGTVENNTVEAIERPATIGNASVHGIEVKSDSGSATVTVTGNTLENNPGHVAIDLMAGGNTSGTLSATVSNNTITGTVTSTVTNNTPVAQFGIAAGGLSGLAITGNTISDMQSPWGVSAIWLDTMAPNATVSVVHNTLVNNDNGVMLTGASGVTIANNTISAGSTGITLGPNFNGWPPTFGMASSSNNVVQGNVITGSPTVATSYVTTGSATIAAVASVPVDGVLVWDGSNNTISGNEIAGFLQDVYVGQDPIALNNTLSWPANQPLNPFPNFGNVVSFNWLRNAATSQVAPSYGIVEANNSQEPTNVEAKDNWWNTARGPQGWYQGTLQGTRGNVDDSTWLTGVQLTVNPGVSIGPNVSPFISTALVDNTGATLNNAQVPPSVTVTLTATQNGQALQAAGLNSAGPLGGVVTLPALTSGSYSVSANVSFAGVSTSGEVHPLSGTVTISAQTPAAPLNTLYVSPSGNDATGNGTFANPYATVAQALTVAPVGATILVEPGTYHLQAPLTVTQAVYLESDAAHGGTAANTVIDATGQPNAIVITGAAASGTVIRGLTFQGAEKAALVVMNTSNLTIADNVIQQNDQSYAASNLNLPPGPNGFTATNGAGCSPQDDCEALHLIGVTNSIVTGNTVTQNLDGGIYLTDETGPTFGNQITDNTVTNNAVDCGITLASHSGFGVYNNTVAGNTSSGNGGAGILMATPITTGAVYGNTAINNVVTGNFGGGIVLHTHVSGSNVSGNVISQNQISGNQADPLAGTTQSIGISIIGVPNGQITNIQVTQNDISDEYYGVYESNVSKVTVSGNNVSSSVTVDVYPPPASQGITRILQPGWNTLSLPFVPDASTVQELTGLLQGPSPVLYWDPATNSWQALGNLTASQQQSLLQTPMQGFYVEVPGSSGSVQLTLTPNTSVQPGPPSAFPVQSGWNLVGPSAIQGSQSSADFLAGLPASSIPIIVDPNGSPQSVVNPLQPGSGTLTVQDGFAYWVYGTNLPSGSALAGGIPIGSVNGG